MVKKILVCFYASQCVTYLHRRSLTPRAWLKVLQNCLNASVSLCMD